MYTKLIDEDELLALGPLGPCQHHWVLEPPAGPVSKGECRSCGEERDFLNYLEGSWRLTRRDPTGSD